MRYRFELGSGEGIVSVPTTKVSDGRWHEVRLERDGSTAHLTVDGKHVAHGSAPGTNGILNLYSDDLFLGAEVRQHPAILGLYNTNYVLYIYFAIVFFIYIFIFC